MKSSERISCLLAFWGCVAGCSQQPRACARVDTCPANYECLANRCMIFGGEPVAADTERLVRVPTQMRVTGSQTSDARIPQTVTFGDPASGSQQLYLVFPAIPKSFRISAAFLLLEPSIPTTPADRDVKIGLRCAPSASTEANEPCAAALGVGIARSGSEYPLRIDATDLVRAIQTNSTSNLSFVVAAEDSTPGGVTYQLGRSRNLPILEVYGYSAIAERPPRATPPEPSPSQHTATEL